MNQYKQILKLIGGILGENIEVTAEDILRFCKFKNPFKKDEQKP